MTALNITMLNNYSLPPIHGTTEQIINWCHQYATIEQINMVGSNPLIGLALIAGIFFGFIMCQWLATKNNELNDD